MVRNLLGLCGILALVIATGAGPAAQASPTAKKPRLSIPVPKSGDFSVGIVTVKAKGKPGKPVPKNLKVKLRLASKVAPQVTVAGSVR